MSLQGSKRSSISTIRSKSTRRSSSNLALIQEQSTPPTGSPILTRDSYHVDAPLNPSTGGTPTRDQYDDTTPLNPNHNMAADLKAVAAMLPGAEEGKKDRKRRKKPETTGWAQVS